MATPKVATVLVEMADGSKVDVKEIAKKVREVKGTVTAYVNPVEGKAYCVDKEDKTTAISLV